ncbi:MAG: hypothetical protein KTR31_37955 [Myxococcales bacterium]|nr:hypothetical protein [Myxococcales bacterium]
MADITIRFRYDPKTGKRQLVVKYDSDEDALQHEHERDHRALVEELIGRPIGDEEELVVERGEGGAVAVDEPTGQGQRQGSTHGSGQ